MKLSNKLFLMFAAAALLFVLRPSLCPAAENRDDPPAVEAPDKPLPPEGNIPWDDQPAPLREKAAGRMLERIRQSNPQEAKELEQLREKDPPKFRQVMRERFAGKMHPQPMRHGVMEPQRPLQQPGPGRPEAGKEGIREQMKERHEEYIKWLQKNYPDDQ